MSGRDDGSRDWLLPFLLISAIWGASFLFIKAGDRAFAPLQVAFGRCALGAIALLAVLAIRRERLPRGRATPVGAAVVLLGVALTQGRLRRRPSG
jgi:drug/metabolite transporter (DMT)-like permease